MNEEIVLATASYGRLTTFVTTFDDTSLFYLRLMYCKVVIFCFIKNTWKPKSKQSETSESTLITIVT